MGFLTNNGKFISSQGKFTLGGLVDLSKATISSIQDQVYTGSSICPTPSVTYKDTILVKDVDYSLSYSNNIQVGVASLTAAGIAPAKGSKSANFNIGININNALIPAISDQKYTGSAIIPNIDVYAGSQKLVLNTHYTVSCSNNIEIGTAKATVTGIGLCSGSKDISFNIIPSIPYLCFTAKEAGSTVRMSVNGTPTQGQAFQYSADGQNWSKFTPGSTRITLANVGDKVYFKGNNSTVSESNSIYYKFMMTGKIAGSGNIQSLLDGIGSLTSAPAYCYYYMFQGCSSLTTAPQLPATTLANNCYYGMFNGCSSLTTPPVLPATTLVNSCYSQMFFGCRSLTTAPALPATTLGNSCYQTMFLNCTSLITAPALPATTLANSCYSNMFSGCTSLTTAPALPATTLANNCYYQMFQSCASLTTAPALPATTLANNCYYQMFQSCASLTTAPALPATTLAGSCYYNMFNGCTSLQVYSSSGEGHTNLWRIPTSGSAIGSYTSQTTIFENTIGDYASTSSIDFATTNEFYTQNTPV